MLFLALNLISFFISPKTHSLSPLDSMLLLRVKEATFSDAFGAFYFVTSVERDYLARAQVFNTSRSDNDLIYKCPF